MPAVGALLVASLIAMIAVLANPAQAAPDATNDESAYVAKLNEVRRNAGVAPLIVDSELTSLSRGWAQQMANAGQISHASHPSDGISRYWLKVGENVGTGPDVAAIMAAFIASPGHYKNIVDPDFKYVGVGVVYNGPAMYTTHRFMKLDEPPPAPPPPPPSTPKAPVATAPPATQPPVPNTVAPKPAAAAPIVAAPPTTTAPPPPTTTALPPPPPPASAVRIATLLTALRNSTL